jgi:SGNH domain (fused to AT3 domains)
MGPEPSVVNISLPACLPFSAFPNCKKAFNSGLDFLTNNTSIKTVILTGYFSFLQSGFKYGNIEGKRVAAEVTPINTQAFLLSATNMIESLAAAGKKIIILRDIPDLIFRPRDCVSFNNSLIAWLRGALEPKLTSECGISAQEFGARSKPYDAVMDDLLSRYPAILSFDPRPVFCNESRCMAFEDGIFLYWNSDHLTIEGSDRVIARMLGSTPIDTPSKVGSD